MVELYVQMQKERQSLLLASPAPYPEFINRDRYHAASIPAVWQTQGHLTSVANVVNSFWKHLHDVAAWANVFKTATDADKFNAVIEFVGPIADHCLGAPYSLKQMLIVSTCKISHQTRRFSEKSSFSEKSLKRDEALNFKQAEKLASGFAGWPALRDALAQLDDDQYKTETNNYRRRLNHGFRPSIEYGNFLFVERTSSPDDRGSVYNFGSAPPLQLEKLVPALSRQYDAALRSYDRYFDLIKEQHQRWP
jgi:hypothetical protein